LFTEAASPNNGVDVIFSEELRAYMKEAMESNCNNIDTQCVNGIRDLMVNPRTELESRQLAAAGVGLFALIALASKEPK
jgi:hypothetical protein